MSARTTKQKAERSYQHSIMMIERLQSDRIEIQNKLRNLADAAKALAAARAACSFINLDGAPDMLTKSDELHNKCAQEQKALKRYLAHVNARLEHHRANEAILNVFSSLNNKQAENFKTWLRVNGHGREALLLPTKDQWL